VKIIHIYRGIGPESENTVIDNQIRSLENLKDLEQIKCPIPSGGLAGYFKASRVLKDYIKSDKPDLIHAHYSYSGFLATLTTLGKVKVICSLMGSDVFNQKPFFRRLTMIFSKFLWNATIVKSRQMKTKIKHAVIIPNSVDLRNFRPIDKKIALEKTGFRKDRQHIIFIAVDPTAQIKNLSLAREAIKSINKPVDFHVLSSISFSDLPYYYNAADVVLLTSFSEGSPNVIKEAMACNCPIVSTDVGDVKEIAEGIDGCYLCTFSPDDVVLKLKQALSFNKRTNGRSNIRKFDNPGVATTIYNLYKQVVIQ